MNNTTVTAMCVGPMVRLARELRIGPGRLLMPLAFASILGGTCTLIGTSTNVAVSGYLKKNQLGELGMFEFAGLGLLMLIAGMVYMIFIGRHLLPNQVEEVDDVVVRDYLAEAVVLEGSPLIGQHVIASDFSILGFQVLKIVRGKDQLEDVQSLRFEQGDVVLLAGRVKDLIKIKKIEGIEIMEDLRLLRGGVNLRNVQIAEVVVTPRSRLVGRTLKESKFRQSSGLSVLALMRGDKSMTGLIADTMVRAGDMLLVQGPMDRIRRYEDDAELVVISEHLTAGYGMKKGLILLGLFLLAITASSIGLLPAALALLMVAVAAVLMRAITMEVAYENIEWRLLILIAGMMGFGQAMQSSGAAELVVGSRSAPWRCWVDSPSWPCCSPSR
jgi:di/tricarboxylate transporter